MIAPWPLTTMIVAPTAGTLSDKVPAGLLGGIGMAVATVALLLLAFLPAHPDYWRRSRGGWRCAASGFGLFLSPNARLIVGSAPRHRAAVGGRPDLDDAADRADAGRDRGRGAARLRLRRGADRRR